MDLFITFGSHLEFLESIEGLQGPQKQARSFGNLFFGSHLESLDSFEGLQGPQKQARSFRNLFFGSFRVKG